MQATVQGRISGPTKALRWSKADGIRMPFLSWKDESEPIETPPGGMRLDLTKDIGLRLWLREGHDKTTLLVQFHHSVCDGIGLFAFMEDLLAAYGRLEGATALPLRDLSHADLPRRNGFHLTSEDRRRRLGKDLVRTLKFFKVIPAPLIAPRKPALGLTAAPDLQAVVRSQIDTDLVRRLAATAKDAGATLNDIMLRELFLALENWHESLAPGARRPWFRIAMPTDLRLPGDERLSAANVVSMVFLDRRNASRCDPDALLRDIARETAFIKKERMGLTLIRVVETLGRLWGALALLFRLPLCSTTAVLTNLGRPFARSPLASADGLLTVPGLVLEGLETLPPLRKRTRVALSVNSYGGPMRVTMRYDTTVYTENDAREILAGYCHRLRAAAGATRLSPETTSEALPQDLKVTAEV